MEPEDRQPISFDDVCFTLRTRQAQYLEYLAERDSEPASRALAKVIEQAIERIYVDPPMRTQKIRRHFSLPTTCRKYINLLSTRWGLPQSDVVRRLLDDAEARDATV